MKKSELRHIIKEIIKEDNLVQDNKAELIDLYKRIKKLNLLFKDKNEAINTKSFEQLKAKLGNKFDNKLVQKTFHLLKKDTVKFGDVVKSVLNKTSVTGQEFVDNMEKLDILIVTLEGMI